MGLSASASSAPCSWSCLPLSIKKNLPVSSQLIAYIHNVSNKLTRCPVTLAGVTWVHPWPNPKTNAIDLKGFERELSGGEIRGDGVRRKRDTVSGSPTRPRDHLPIRFRNASTLGVSRNARDFGISYVPHRHSTITRPVRWPGLKRRVQRFQVGLQR